MKRAEDLVYQTLDEHLYQENRFLRALYGIAAPRNPPAGATFKERDRVRQGRIASVFLFFVLCTVILAALVGLFGPNKQILNIVPPMFAAILASGIANRLKWVSLAGVILSFGLTASMTYSMLTARGGLTPLDTQILFLIVMSDMVFVAILPIRFFFVPGVVNLALSIFVLSFARHTPALTAMLVYAYFPTFFRLVQLHIVCTGIPTILIVLMREQIKRAYNAEEMIKLQKILQEQNQKQLQEKQELESEIRRFIAAYTAVANGEIQARIPLEEMRHLNVIARLFNTHLGRYHGLLQKEHEAMQLRMHMEQGMQALTIVQRLKNQLPHVLETVERAANAQQPIYLTDTATPLDTLIHHINGRRISQQLLTQKGENRPNVS